MVRSQWVNLNGSWSYAITDSGAAAPTQYDGTILVPFPIESKLSGVRKAVTETQRLWYHRIFQAPHLAAGERLLLHFGAVDWESEIMVNGHQVGRHLGGYDPFTLDITDALRPGNEAQDLVVRIWDPTDHGTQPYGKQSLTPSGMRPGPGPTYTAVTGIWQTVWLEPVPKTSIQQVVVVPDIDASTARVFVEVPDVGAAEQVTVTAMEGKHTVSTATGKANDTIALTLPHEHLWSPDHPYLYNLTVRLSSGDHISSYFGMRKIAVAKDSDGFDRLFLNNHPLFELGMLDQGWWPDGLYTAPTEEALRYDIIVAKKLGFNLLRKHVKVEPERWYYAADQLGMLVWQDMPEAPNLTQASRTEFNDESHRIVASLRAHPAIVMWVIFNESWGQFDIPQEVAWFRAADPSRLVNNMSGLNVHDGFDSAQSHLTPEEEQAGDVMDMHHYRTMAMSPIVPHHAAVLGEFGGLGLTMPGHLWIEQGKNDSYVMFKGQEALGQKYRALLEQIKAYKAQGLAAAIYTQVSDVEIEVNGIMTYDRAIVKLPESASADNAAVIGDSKVAVGPTQPAPIALVIHGGAGDIARGSMSPELEQAYRAGLKAALDSGYAVLRRGGSSLDAVEASIRYMEDDSLFNAGKGAVFTAEGTNELDAAIMDGRTLDAGSVADLQHIKNPIHLARLVMEKSPHVMLVGPGAEAFAVSQGIELVPPHYFFTQHRWDQYEAARAADSAHAAGHASAETGDVAKHFGTVGAVALDRDGNLAAGTSTGGTPMKRFGRVGDSPIIGAGTYANNASCAISATGHGEDFIRHTVASDICARVRYEHLPLAEAADQVVMGDLVAAKGDGGVIALDRQGHMATPFNTSAMFRAYIGPDGTAVVKIYRDE